ncbi:hypothetical protein HPP92_007907 [Vanilla planifolia]|uniref:Uncharacterized protein n=1 Tax=Vanilla planifolia TaxID=51239 RepID=A0A835RB42_VANPL|nr:hypothetical protein HPP92_007907 [Vanilla planifolia]
MEKTQEKAGGSRKRETSETERKGRFRRICVFCGSRAGNNPSFMRVWDDGGAVGDDSLVSVRHT